ncbi:MAG: hypothetical protein NTV94_09630, partial [Planctomycetota bacterium]|nr:hypothetical protein [Planctomycetota bacterium]
PAWFQSARILEACRGLFEHPQPSTTPSPAPLTAPIATAKPAPALAISPSAPSFNFEPAPTPAATSSEPDALAATPLFAPALTNTPDLAAFIAASSQVPPTQPAASLSIENCLEPATLPLLATNTVTQAPSINTDRVVDATVSSAPISTFTAPRASFAAAAQPAPAKPTTLRDTARTWLSWGLAVRDQFSAVPPLPIMLWFVGAGLMLLVFAIRMIAMRRILARARPARDSMLTLVDSCARQAGLSAAPLTLETHDRLSPMIVCGLRPTLVLPIALWKELDEDARRAVVLHELAHLRRRDHRTAWFVAFVGLVYWWHPIVWWARRRINEEADTCCDAWVTSLLPEGRRAYARALLATKSFLSLPNQNLAVRCAPPGLGVMSGGAKRLARRITMVMTQSTAPRPSVLGAAAAMMIAAVGTFVMPGIACPPSEQPEAGAQAAAAAPRAKARKATRASSPVAGTAPAQSEFFGEATALEAMRAGRDQAEGAAEPGARAGAVGGDAQSLEKAILELERRLEKMEIDLGGQQTPRPRAARNAFPALSPTAPASPFGAMRAPVAVTPVAPLRGTLAVPAYPASGFGTSSRLFGVTAPTNIAVVDSGEIIART